MCDKDEEKVLQGSEIKWGESFIGQDVCGSKYNNDPFDGMDNKKDAWKEMKKKIELIVKENGKKNIEDFKSIPQNVGGHVGRWSISRKICIINNLDLMIVASYHKFDTFPTKTKDKSFWESNNFR